MAAASRMLRRSFLTTDKPCMQTALSPRTHGTSNPPSAANERHGIPINWEPHIARYWGTRRSANNPLPVTREPEGEGGPADGCGGQASMCEPVWKLKEGSAASVHNCASDGFPRRGCIVTLRPVCGIGCSIKKTTSRGASRITLHSHPRQVVTVCERTYCVAGLLFTGCMRPHPCAHSPCVW